MYAYIHLALTWILFLALFPISFLWLRKAYRIAVKKDYSLVAMKRGVPAPNPRKFIVPEIILHTVAALLVIYALYGVIVGGWHYNEWTALAGSAIWCKILFSFVIARHAHPPKPKAKKGGKASVGKASTKLKQA
ncbi:MAG: hypothetical protein Q4G54_10215 [Pelistega sp.]|nr:hypothetical protein [Pelistega sp.]